MVTNNTKWKEHRLTIRPIDISITDEFIQRLFNRCTSLTKKIYDTNNWRAGCFYAIVPETQKEDCKYNPYTTLKDREAIITTGVQLIPYRDKAIEILSLAIDRDLRENREERFIIFEEIIIDIEEARTDYDQVFYVDNDVFHYITPSTSSINGNKDVINNSNDLVNLIAYISESTVLMNSIYDHGEYEMADFDEFMRNVSVVVVGAFDNESYIIWCNNIGFIDNCRESIELIYTDAGL